MTSRLFTPPGEAVQQEELRLPKAQQLASFLADVGEQVFAKLLAVRRVSDLREVLVVEINIERPQRLVHPIKRCEVVAISLDASDDKQPEVLALRTDFPAVPHCNATVSNSPRSLCLYDQPYEAVRLTWTPLRFMRRIHQWLSKTAMGTLHLSDQPLEPLLFASLHQLIVPADFLASNIQITPRLLHISHHAKNGNETTYAAGWTEPSDRAKLQSIVAAFSTKPQTHGVIHRQPQTLAELDALCRAADLSLVAKLTELIRVWHCNKPVPHVLQAQLIIVIALPKRRKARGKVEATEMRAFLTGATVKELGEQLGIIDSRSDVAKGAAGYIIGTPKVTPSDLDAVPLLPVQVLHALSPATAAVMNGTSSSNTRILAVGCGALGSQVANNLARAGFGRWTLVDHDTYLPHNSARHLLPRRASGLNKASVLASVLNEFYDEPDYAVAIPADVLKLGDQQAVLDAAISTADCLFDFSASVAVSRHFASKPGSPRRLAAFVTPSGAGAVLAIEDAERGIKQDWLEMLHYREVLGSTSLRKSLISASSNFRYGNGCRDIASQLAQADLAVWAGVIAKRIPKMLASQRASLSVFEMEASGSIAAYEIEPTVPHQVRLLGWTLYFDQWLIEKLASFRRAKLPNETGGVLVGVFDSAANTCYLIDALPSPPDSTEWPTSYIRGCKGLQDAVEEIEKVTLGQVGYAGEWHSHPRRASVAPSSDDFTAYAWLCEKMTLEGLPAIMMIAGDDAELFVVAADGARTGGREATHR